MAIFCTVVVPTVPMILSPKLFGTGFGMMEMLQNLGLSVFPLISGAIRETKPDSELKGFHRQTLFFFIVSCLCLGICIILYGLDYGRGKKLHRQDFRLTYVKKHMKD